MALKIAGLVLVFDPYADEAFDLPKALFSHAVEWLTLGLLVAAVARYGMPRVGWSAVKIAVVAVLATTALAAATAEVPYLALFGDRSRYLGLFHVADMVVLAVAVAAAVRSHADWAIVAAGVCVGLFGSVGYAAIQIAGADPFKWGDLVPHSTFGNTGYFAEFLIVVIASCGAVIVTSLRRHWGLALGAAVVAAPAAALLLILAARSALLGVASAAVGLLLVIGRQGISRRRAALVALALAVVALPLATVLIDTPLGRRTIDTMRGSGLVDRAPVYRVAFEATVARPLVGWGPDSVGVFTPRFQRAEDERAGLNYANNAAHSWVLQASSTTGLLGLLALFILVGATVSALWRALDRQRVVAVALLCGYLAYLASMLTTVTSVSHAWIPWVATGGAIALADGEPGRTVSPRLWGAATWRWKKLLSAGLLAIALAGSWTGLSALAASRALHEVRGALREPQDPRAALQYAQQAVTADPGRAAYWDALGFAFFTNGRYREASAAYDQATKRAPYDPLVWVNLAHSQAWQAKRNEPGDPRGRAFIALERAGRIAPNASQVHAALSEVARDLDDSDMAFREGVRAIQLAGTPFYDRLLPEVAGLVRDPAAAVQVMTSLVVERDGPLLRLALARASRALGDWYGVRVHARRALELEPGDPNPAHLLEEASRH